MDKNLFEKLCLSLGLPIQNIDHIEILENGNEIFPHILNTIREAKKYILFETFIYWNGEIAKKFTDLLSKKSKEGVECYLIFDHFGCKKLDKDLIQKLKHAGVKISFYNPITKVSILKTLFGGENINRRTHRKILVTDGFHGYTGGIGIADQWQGNARNKDEWKDLHFYITGSIVNQLQSTFLDNWLEYEVEKIDLDLLHFTEDNFESKNDSNHSVHKGSVITSSPLSKHDTLHRFVLYLIDNAKSSIKIITPYFIPSKEIRKKLIEKSKKGLLIEIILPATHVDKKITLHSSRYCWGDLLRNGIKIFNFNQTFNHTKLLLIDSQWSSIGSSNFDNRSLRLNEEANLNILSHSFSSEILTKFEKDKSVSEKISYDNWAKRPLYKKFLDYLASKFSRFL